MQGRIDLSRRTVVVHRCNYGMTINSDLTLSNRCAGIETHRNSHVELPAELQTNIAARLRTLTPNSAARTSARGSSKVLKQISSRSVHTLRTCKLKLPELAWKEFPEATSLVVWAAMASTSFKRLISLVT